MAHPAQSSSLQEEGAGEREKTSSCATREARILKFPVISEQQKEVNQEARRLIRPILWKLCLEKVRAKAYIKFPKPSRGGRYKVERKSYLSFK